MLVETRRVGVIRVVESRRERVQPLHPYFQTGGDAESVVDHFDTSRSQAAGVEQRTVLIGEAPKVI